jgi:hypothetical protein
MSISTSLNSIKIKNNIIDVGYSSNGSQVIYTYDPALIEVGGDAIIFGNTLSGCIGNGNAGTNLINIISGSCLITNNTFVRGISSINSYVNNAGSNDQIVSHNIFDHPTINGSSTNLCLNLTTTSLFNENLNQVKSYSIFNMQTVELAHNFTTTSVTNVDVTGMTITVPACNVGDLVDIAAHIIWYNSTIGAGTIWIHIQDGATTIIDIIDLNTITSGTSGPYTKLYTVANAGSLVVKLQAQASAGTTTLLSFTDSTTASTNLRTISYRF